MCHIWTLRRPLDTCKPTDDLYMFVHVGSNLSKHAFEWKRHSRQSSSDFPLRCFSLMDDSCCHLLTGARCSVPRGAAARRRPLTWSTVGSNKAPGNQMTERPSSACSSRHLLFVPVATLTIFWQSPGMKTHACYLGSSRV